MYSVFPLLLQKEEADDEKINIALFGALYGSQPLGREMLIRLARHLSEGYKRSDDPSIRRLFDSVNLYIFPMIDFEFFDPANDGDCTYNQDNMNHEVGAKFRRGAGDGYGYGLGKAQKVKAVKQFLKTHRVDIALSIEAGGVFMRLPYDEEGPHSRKMHPSNLKNLHFLAEAFGNEYTVPKSDVKPQIVTGSSLGKYRNSFLDYAFSQGIDVLAASM